MGRAKFMGLLVGVPAGLVYFFLFGLHFWRSLAVGFFVASLYSGLAAIFLTVDKIAEKLGVSIDED